MAKVELFSKPKMESDLAASGVKWIAPPKMAFKVVVDFDDRIYKEIKSDAILLEQMNQAVRKVYDQTCDGIQSKLKAFDKLIDGMVDNNAPQASIDKQLTGLDKSIEQDRKVAESAAEKAALEAWKKYAAKKKEYLKYGIKITATVVAAAAGLATSIALTVTSGFTGGASAVFSILGMVKSTVTIGKELYSAWIEIERAQDILLDQIKVVRDEIKGGGLKKVNEMSAIVINQFVGISQPCIKNCQTQMDTVEKKLLGIEIKTHEASKTLNRILDKEEELKKDFMKEVVDRLAKHSSPKAQAQIRQIEKQLDGAIGGPFRTVEKQLAVVNQLAERWQRADETTAKLRPIVDRLGAMRTLDEKIFENLIVLIDLPLAALKGNVPAKEAQDLVEGLVPAATALAFDKIKGKALDGTFLT